MNTVYVNRTLWVWLEVVRTCVKISVGHSRAAVGHGWGVNHWLHARWPDQR